MAVRKEEVFPQPELTEPQQDEVRLAEIAFDALLRLNKRLSVVLYCTRDPKIRKELEHIYTHAGWKVHFEQAGETEYYWVDIKP